MDISSLAKMERLSFPTKWGRLLIGNDGCSVGDWKDVIARVLGRVAGRNPGVDAVIVRDINGAKCLSEMLADSMASLPKSHPFKGRPVWELDASAMPYRLDEAAEVMEKEVLSNVVLSVVWSKHADEVTPALQSMLRAALGRGLPVLAISTLTQWKHFQAEDELASLKLREQQPIDATPRRAGQPLRTLVDEEIAAAESFHGTVFDSDAVANVLSLACARKAHEVRAQGLEDFLTRVVDQAALAACLDGASRVEAMHVQSVEQPLNGPRDLSESHIAETLKQRVVGQSEAVDLIARALSLNPMFRLHTQRPRAVLLLVGPSGSGKTETAKAIAQLLEADDPQLILVNMAALDSNHASASLLGSPPGYVGSTDSQSWLTTRIEHQPTSVLLLDEVEKAHLAVVNSLLLEIVGNGTLTDMQGTVVDCRNLIVILTANTGSWAYHDQPPGFGDRRAAQNRAEDIVLREVTNWLSPELLNRIDEVILFQPIIQERAAAVTRMLLDHVSARARKLDLEVAFDDTVVTHIVETGSSSRLGTRSLQRQIETSVCLQLGSLASGSYCVEVIEGEIAVTRVVGALRDGDSMGDQRSAPGFVGKQNTDTLENPYRVCLQRPM